MTCACCTHTMGHDGLPAPRWLRTARTTLPWLYLCFHVRMLSFASQALCERSSTLARLVMSTLFSVRARLPSTVRLVRCHGVWPVLGINAAVLRP